MSLPGCRSSAASLSQKRRQHSSWRLLLSSLSVLSVVGDSSFVDRAIASVRTAFCRTTSRLVVALGLPVAGWSVRGPLEVRRSSARGLESSGATANVSRPSRRRFGRGKRVGSVAATSWPRRLLSAFGCAGKWLLSEIFRSLWRFSRSRRFGAVVAAWPRLRLCRRRWRPLLVDRGGSSAPADHKRRARLRAVLVRRLGPQKEAALRARSSVVVLVVEHRQKEGPRRLAQRLPVRSSHRGCSRWAFTRSSGVAERRRGGERALRLVPLVSFVFVRHGSFRGSRRASHAKKKAKPTSRRQFLRF